MASKELIDSTLSALDFCLKGRDDFFLTTSFGYQSALIFFLFAEIGVSPKCLFIKSKLAAGGIDQQIDYLTARYDIDLHVVDRDAWLEEELRGQDFMSLEGERKKFICANLKREPLLDFIRKNSLKIWISAIRKDQTQSRAATQFMEVTDLNVIKVSPLYAWTKAEARGLILSHELSVNNEYFDLCKLNETKECGLHY
jgi:phosphoadenosine phosphosulfate reductase